VVPTMTASLVAPPTHPSVAWFHSGDFGFSPTKRFSLEGGKNVLKLTDVPVFRSGVFRDSMGELNTWETLHMTQMQNNFDYLRAHKTFENVPVRRGHGSFFSDAMDSLIGWHTALRTQDMQSPVDGVTYTYLLTDFYIFDKDAAEKVAEDNWPNRSSEIGTYVNNAQTEYWPCYMGFAYVDIPAVEGLNFRKYQKDAGPRFSILVDDPKEFGVTSLTNPAAPAGPAAPASPPSLELPGAGQPAQSTQPTQPLQFSIGGRQTTDYAAVQAHIIAIEGRNATLEQFATESAAAGRRNFVAALARESKILQTQVGDDKTGLTAHALSLNDEQFAAFKAIYEAAPSATVLQQHGQTNGTGNPIVSGGQPKNERTERISVLTEIVARHRMGGTTEADIAKMPSYIELQQLTAAAS